MSKNDVTFQREEYKAALPAWNIVDDATSGDVDGYLPALNKTDTSPENKVRNDEYKEGAVYYNATRRTLQSLVGAAFRKVPTCTAPTGLEYIKDDIDGNGLSIYQQSQTTLSEALKKGRHALLVDYPQTEGDSSRAEMNAGGIRATVAAYDARSVRNWRTERFGAVYRYTLVVLFEQASEPTDDGFGEEAVEQYRVLRLTDGVYTQEVWRKDSKSAWSLYQEPWIVKNGAGKAWSEIPFTFVGSSNNDWHVDDSPIYDLASLNIAHYRNSADYEESVHIHGQATMVVNIGEMPADVFEKANPNGLQVGARGGFVVGNGGSADLLQMEANTAAKEAMDQKQEQMIAMGARLITAGSAVKTATEAQNENETEHSVLSLAVSNVSEAYTQCLEWMLEFMGGAGEVVYEINQEFTKPNLDAQTLAALVQLWTTGKYPEADLWDQLRKYGLIDPEKEDETIKDELERQGGGLALEVI
tara:strand:- start:27232 stop:28647 length:1416 start_codon:yes stop_codon:yes gene_type:complete